MNVALENRLLDQAERALLSACGGRRESEMLFVQRLLGELGEPVSALRLSPAELFRAVLSNQPLMHKAREVLEVLAMPLQRPAGALRPGDWLLRAVPGTGDVGHVSVLVSGGLLTQPMLASEGIAAESTQSGYYGIVIEAGAFPHSRSRPFARRLLDSSGRVPPNTVLLRPRFLQLGAAAELPPDSQVEFEEANREGTVRAADALAELRRVVISFDGIFQCRLPTDPDPSDHKRGNKGWTFAHTGEPDLDRIIRFNNPVSPRVCAASVGVRITSVELDGRSVSDALKEKLVDLGPKSLFAGERGGPGREPIDNFEFHIRGVADYLAGKAARAPEGQGVRTLTTTEQRDLKVFDWKDWKKRRLDCLERSRKATSGLSATALKERIDKIKQLMTEDIGIRGQVLKYFVDYPIRINRGVKLDPQDSDVVRRLKSAGAYDFTGNLRFYSFDADGLVGRVRGFIACNLNVPSISRGRTARDTEEIENGLMVQEKGLSRAPFLLGVSTTSPAGAGQVEDEQFEDFDQFAEDDPVGGAGRSAPVPATPATIGFEFDLNIGLSRDVFTARAADMPHGAAFPGPGDKITDHREDDGTGKLADGFQVKADGPRLEIATIPIRVDDDATFLAVVKNVIAFARELETERGKVTPDRSLSVTDVAGHPVRFTHPRTVISKFPLVIAVRGPQNGLKWPSDRGVWAAPQATITILLEHVGELIDAIAKSVGTGLGKALSGGPPLRLGVRSDIVVKAKRRVLADRATKIGTELSDKSKVTAADYSLRLAGLLMLMTSYMLSGEVVDSGDYELFAKAYLPINVKAPFRDLFREALSARERLVFKELYFDNRANFFALAKDRATTHDEGNELFPLKVRGPDLDRFHLHRLTWGTLLDNTVNDIPLKVTRANSVAKKHHALGDEVLWAPISKIIPFAATKPRVALELRRIGFAAHPVKFWEPLMNTVRTLTRKL